MERPAKILREKKEKKERSRQKAKVKIELPRDPVIPSWAFTQKE